MPLLGFTEFCQTLQQSAEKLEWEIRTNINEFNNSIFDNKLDDTKISVEQAKDYHRNEISIAISEILKLVKKMIFHQTQIDWLSNDITFSPEYLKRFSYIKRQVYDLNAESQKPIHTRSVENLTFSRKMKREQRRTVSEVSLETLDAWEKYLDKKEESVIEQTEDIKKKVPKRKLSNARARKKFVSSTLEGILEDEVSKSLSLDAIDEAQCDDNKGDPVIQNILHDFYYNYNDKSEKFHNRSQSCGNLTSESYENQSNTSSIDKDELNQEIIKDSLDDTSKDESTIIVETKPRIVDVIYKKGAV